jgi:putative heme-binding domain-containing protein
MRIEKKKRPPMNQPTPTPPRRRMDSDSLKQSSPPGRGRGEFKSALRAIVRGVLFFAGCVVVAAASVDEVIPHRQDQPPNKPYSPQEALSKMTVPAGFHVELVASEPDIVNPIAMTFDDRGRIWITESIEYPRKPGGLGRDRVKVLEDTDGDGSADKVTIFAEGMNIPTGVAVGYGGVWVLNSPDLLFLREKDGKEVSREVVLTGFGRADFHELPSSLTWGPDGWLYGLNGVFNPSRVQSNNGKEYRFTCALWRVHPRTREFQVFAEGTSNPYGLAWDSEGSAIVEVCHWANDHLFHFVETGYYQRQAGAYPPFTMKIGSITDHGHQKTAYCGISFLETDAFPAPYRGRVCVGNLHGGCINVDRLQREGATYLAKSEPDLLTANDVWFMPVSLKIGPDGSLYVLDWYDRYHCSQDAVRDPAGVDRLRGRLYRLRYGETPRAQKFNLANESDDQLISRLASGNIFYRESAQRILTERLTETRPEVSRVSDPGAKTLAELRAKLEAIAATGASSSPTDSKTEEPRTKIEPRLTVSVTANRAARLHSLWALIGSGSLNSSFHQNLLSHSDSTVRAWAVRAAGNFGKVAGGIRERVIALARDASPDVQLQVAIASRKIDGCDALPVLLEVLARCGQDKMIPAIVWPNLHPLLETEGGRLVSLLMSADQITKVPNNHVDSPESGTRATRGSGPLSPAVAALLPNFVERLLGAQNPDVDAVVSLLEFTAPRAPERGTEGIAALSAKMGELKESALTRLKERLQPWVEKILREERSTPLQFSVQLLAARLQLASLDAAEVRRKFISRTEPEATRLQALEAMIAFRDESLLGALPEVLSTDPPALVQRVLGALGRSDNPRLADVILAQYSKLAPELQPLAIDLIMQREPWARKLLDAVLASRFPKSALNANHLRKILESNDRDALWAVEKAFGKIREERNPERDKVVADMSAFLKKGLGDPTAGQRVFRNLCAQCHTIYGEGGRVGPDLTSNGRGSFDQLVASVFDPSLVIGAGYQTVTVVTKDGRNLTGLLTEESEQRVILKLPGEGEESVPRNNVKYTRVSKLSMMPEGIESILDPKDLADLFAYLALDRSPTDPAAKPIPGSPPRAR